jgi:hypothetical protein
VIDTDNCDTFSDGSKVPGTQTKSYELSIRDLFPDHKTALVDQVTRMSATESTSAALVESTNEITEQAEPPGSLSGHSPTLSSPPEQQPAEESVAKVEEVDDEPIEGMPNYEGIQTTPNVAATAISEDVEPSSDEADIGNGPLASPEGPSVDVEISTASPTSVTHSLGNSNREQYFPEYGRHSSSTQEERQNVIPAVREITTPDALTDNPFQVHEN